MNSDLVVLPRKLTAENGAKYKFSGEFFVSHETKCSECNSRGCEVCCGNPISHKIPISWIKIKEIYARIVAEMEITND